MKQNDVFDNHDKKYLQHNIFDEDFLNEKDKALSPIELSDEIPEVMINKSLEETTDKGTNFQSDEENDFKYGSNIIYIESKIEDNDDDFYSILNENVCKIIFEQKFGKKSTIWRKMKNKL